MIHGIHMVNFGNHRDSRLEFGAITALVGRNGSGKTTVLRAIRELASNAGLIRSGFVSLFDEPRLAPSVATIHVRKGSSEFGLSTSGPGVLKGIDGTWGLRVGGSLDPTGIGERVDVQGEWSWKPRASSDDRVWIPEAVLAKVAPDDVSKKRFAELRENLAKVADLPIERHPSSPPDIAVPVSQPENAWLPEVLDCQYLHGVGVNLHLPSYTSEIPPKLTSAGDNLPSVIAYLMTSEPDRFAKLSDAFCRLIPFVTRIRVRPAIVKKREPKIVSVNRKEITYDEDREFSGHELLFDLRSGNGVPASVVSEGTLLILTLLTIFHTTDAPRLVLIDDVEQALHPWAQRGLVEQFRALQKERSSLQLILTTHSPYIIDELDPQEVWMLAEDKSGGAVAKRFADHPDLMRAKDVLTTGEFWSAEGESWIINESEPNSR